MLSRLIDAFRQAGILRSSQIEEALRSVDRKNFVPSSLASLAYRDEALPIGEGQTISQPQTVVFMLELLQPQLGNHIMEIGYGSAWQTALLAHIVGESGRVYAIELLPPLCELGRTNLEKYPELLDRTTLSCQNASAGLPEVAQHIQGFHGVIAAAEVPTVPETWREQLRIGGHLVYPKNRAIHQEIKKPDGTFAEKIFPGFLFVPFVP